MKHAKSKQDQAISLYQLGFSQTEIAEILGVHQATVSRYFHNPTMAEKEDFYQNKPYHAKRDNNGKLYCYNRRYQPLFTTDEETELNHVGIKETMYFYNDGTRWNERFERVLKLNPLIVAPYTQRLTK